VTFEFWIDFDENVEVAHEDDGEGTQAPGVEARVLIGSALPVEGLNLRSCYYYVSNYPPLTVRPRLKTVVI